MDENQQAGVVVNRGGHDHSSPCRDQVFQAGVYFPKSTRQDDE